MRGGGLKTPKYVFHPSPIGGITEPAKAGADPGGGGCSWGLIRGSRIMMRHVKCILLLEWSTTSQRLWVYRISVPYAQKDPRFLFEKRRG